MKPFDGAGPQSKIGIYRIFYHYRNIYAAQSFGQFLYSKRIYGSSRPDPEYIHTIFQGQFYVLGRGYFYGYGKVCLGLYAVKPLQTNFANPFESIRFGTGFPDAGAEKIYAG